MEEPITARLTPVRGTRRWTLFICLATSERWPETFYNSLPTVAARSEWLREQGYTYDTATGQPYWSWLELESDVEPYLSGSADVKPLAEVDR